MGTVGNLVGGFAVILVGLKLLPTISNEISAAAHVSNVTGASNTILSLTPVLFALSVGLVGVIIGVQGLRASGVTNGDEIIYTDEDRIEKSEVDQDLFNTEDMFGTEDMFEDDVKE